MADSMCGPSNALQNFQKQSQGDRTLQQDRLSARTPQSQGFRNAGPSAHNLDPEFEAFQAGALPLQYPEAGFHPGFQRARTPQPPQQHMSAGPASSSWATDFQRMAIGPQPGMQQQGLPQAQHAGGWHQEFAQMNNSQSGMQQQGVQQQHSYNAPLERLSSLATTPFGMNQPMYQSPGMYQPTPQLNADPAPQQLDASAGDTFDEAAFAAAFDQAAKSELQSEQASLSHALQDTNEGVHFHDTPIGADAIHHPDAPSQPLLTPAQESDDLARTAGALLTSVQGDQSDKFANSQFLQLMRQLRDKEVVVEGDHILPAGEAGMGGAGGGSENGNGNGIENGMVGGLSGYLRADGSRVGPEEEAQRDREHMLRIEAEMRGEPVYENSRGEIKHRPLPSPVVPLIPRAMGGGARGARGLRTSPPSPPPPATERQQQQQQSNQDRRAEFDRLAPEDVERAGRVARETGIRGLAERMRVVHGEGERWARRVAEEAVAEEEARMGRSWGDS